MFEAPLLPSLNAANEPLHCVEQSPVAPNARTDPFGVAMFRIIEFEVRFMRQLNVETPRMSTCHPSRQTAALGLAVNFYCKHNVAVRSIVAARTTAIQPDPPDHRLPSRPFADTSHVFIRQRHFKTNGGGFATSFPLDQDQNGCQRGEALGNVDRDRHIDLDGLHNEALQVRPVQPWG